MLYSARNFLFISESVDELAAGCGAYKCFVLPDAPAQAFLIFVFCDAAYMTRPVFTGEMADNGMMV